MMACSVRKRPDHHENSLEREIAPLFRATDHQMIGGDHLDVARHLKGRDPGSKGHLFPAQLEFGEPGSKGFRRRLGAVPALSGRGKTDRNGVESGVKEKHRGLEAQVVGADREHFSAPFLFERSQNQPLALMHRGDSDVAEGCFPPALKLDQAFHLVGFAPKLGLHAAPELRSEVIELLRLPCHLFRVLDGKEETSRKVATSYRKEGAIGRRGDT